MLVSDVHGRDRMSQKGEEFLFVAINPQKFPPLLGWDVGSHLYSTSLSSSTMLQSALLKTGINVDIKNNIHTLGSSQMRLDVRDEDILYIENVLDDFGSRK
jgi:hypothetical protein